MFNTIRAWSGRPVTGLSRTASRPDRLARQAVHSAVLAGAKPEAVAGAFGNSLDEAYRRWHEWA